MRPSPDPAILAEVEEIVGRPHLLTDPDQVAGYCVDWSGRFRGETPAVVRPGSSQEVEAVVAACRRTGTALTLQGGNTGLVGGSVPLAGEVVLGLGRLCKPVEVDAVSGQATAGAGVTIEALQLAAGRAGWAYGVDLAARGSATVGGTVATNAGGLRVLRYGATRAQLLGIDAVLGTGERICHMAGLAKDNTGYDLAQLLCGSEGTLGVVTAARLRLVPPAAARVVALLAHPSAAAAIEAAGALRRRLPSLSAAEVFFDRGLALVCRVTGAAAPFDRPHPAYLLVEASAAVSHPDLGSDLAAAVGSLGESAPVDDVAVAATDGMAARLWQLREAHPTAINTVGTPHKMDVTLPLPALPSFVERVPRVVGEVVAGAETWLFGHAADGNVHVNVTGAAPGDQRVDGAVLELVASMGGSISAEHGIGTAKRHWLTLSRTPAEIEAFRAIKRALDPDQVLNPAVLLPEP